jgi:nascent polypeptide-associated complex subunit alpha
MLPGLGGMNPAQMKAMMRQFGIKSEDLNATKVTIQTAEGKTIVFDSPSVTVVDMKGQKTYTITGEASEEKAGSGVSEEDIQLVSEQAHVSKEKAKEALEEENGDIAQAIVRLER